MNQHFKKIVQHFNTWNAQRKHAALIDEALAIHARHDQEYLALLQREAKELADFDAANPGASQDIRRRAIEQHYVDLKLQEISNTKALLAPIKRLIAFYDGSDVADDDEPNDH